MKDSQKRWVVNRMSYEQLLEHGVITMGFKIDPIVESVVNDLRERSSVGINKYGTTLEENNHDDFLQHLKEELMDAVLYLTKLQSQKNN